MCDHKICADIVAHGTRTVVLLPPKLEKRILSAVRQGKLQRFTVSHDNGEFLDWFYLSGAVIGSKEGYVQPTQDHEHKATVEHFSEALRKIESHDAKPALFTFQRRALGSGVDLVH